jgi:hypothetical protein
MNFQAALFLVLCVWLVTMIACAVALRWNLVAPRKRLVPSVLLSSGALLLGYAGVKGFNVVASKTVNGERVWHFDSRWLFTLTLLFPAATLACTIWKHGKVRS